MNESSQTLTRGTMVEMKWTEIREMARRDAVVLIPIGVVEEHGPHLPLGTDILIARRMCLRIRDRLAAQGVEAVLAPPFYWGVCQATGGIVGSFRIRPETSAALMQDLLASLASFGFRTAFGVTGHNDIAHNIAMIDGFKEADRLHGIRAAYLFNASVMHHYGLSGLEPFLCPYQPSMRSFSKATQPDVHAGDIETTLIGSGYPEMADLEVASGLPPVSVGDDRIMAWLLGGHAGEMSPLGYLGAPAEHASADGEGFLDDVAVRFTEAMLAKGWCSHRTPEARP